MKIRNIPTSPRNQCMDAMAATTDADPKKAAKALESAKKHWKEWYAPNKDLDVSLALIQYALDHAVHHGSVACVTWMLEKAHKFTKRYTKVHSTYHSPYQPKPVPIPLRLFLATALDTLARYTCPQGPEKLVQLWKWAKPIQVWRDKVSGEPPYYESAIWTYRGEGFQASMLIDDLASKLLANMIRKWPVYDQSPPKAFHYYDVLLSFGASVEHIFRITFELRRPDLAERCLQEEYRRMHGRKVGLLPQIGWQPGEDVDAAFLKLTKIYDKTNAKDWLAYCAAHTQKMQMLGGLLKDGASFYAAYKGGACSTRWPEQWLEVLSENYGQPPPKDVHRIVWHLLRARRYPAVAELLCSHQEARQQYPDRLYNAVCVAVYNDAAPGAVLDLWPLLPSTPDIERTSDSPYTTYCYPHDELTQCALISGHDSALTWLMAQSWGARVVHRALSTLWDEKRPECMHGLSTILALPSGSKIVLEWLSHDQDVVSCMIDEVLLHLAPRNQQHKLQHDLLALLPSPPKGYNPPPLPHRAALEALKVPTYSHMIWLDNVERWRPAYTISRGGLAWEVQQRFNDKGEKIFSVSVPPDIVTILWEYATGHKQLPTQHPHTLMLTSLSPLDWRDYLDTQRKQQARPISQAEIKTP